MNILFILDYYYPSKGGVEKVFLNLINSLPKNYNITILTSKFSKSLKKYEKKGNIEIYRIGKKRLSFTILGYFLALKLFKKADIIHTSTYNAAYISFLANIFYKKPIILTSHEIFGKKWYEFKGKIKGFIFKKIEDFIYKLNFFYVFVSNHVKNVALTNYKLNLKKTYTIYNGLNENIPKISKEEMGYNKNDNIAIFLGRPGWTKGLDIIINNIEELRKIVPNLKIILLLLEKNSIKKHKILEKIKNEKNIKIIYEANSNDVRKYIGISDIGIVPSRSEGFGLSAAELSLAGKNKILSDIGALPEINWGKCIFFNPEDNISFIDAIKKFSSGKIKDYGYNKNININNMTKSYTEIYQKLINN